MQYNRLGLSMLNISNIGLGGHTIETTTSVNKVTRLLGVAADLGINFIDISTSPHWKETERVVGKGLSSLRDRYIIATRINTRIKAGVGISVRNQLHSLLDASLSRLNTDYIDLVQITCAQDELPQEEILSVLGRMVEAGKIRAVGCIGFSSRQIAHALWMSDRYGLAPLVSNQAYCTLTRQEMIKEQLRACRNFKLGYIALVPWGDDLFLSNIWSTTFSSISTSPKPTFKKQFEYAMHQHNKAILQKLVAWAAERQHSMSELAVSMLISQPSVTSVLLGTRNIEQITTYLNAGIWQLTRDEMKVVELLSSNAESAYADIR